VNFAPPPQPPSLLPESAPFTPQQRAWLNGFFAGLISVDGSAVTPLSPAESDALMSGALAKATDPTADGDDGEAPWHDQSLPLADRMKLAQGRPLRRRLMAAMAQQDCGQCGYNCQDYSDAIARKTEERLNLCVPGGKETARMVKTLYAEFGAQPAAPAVIAAASAAVAQAPAATIAPAPAGRSRDNPAIATFLSRTRLNKPGSAKETWHVEFDLAGSGIEYAVGDSFGIFPANDPSLADAVIAALDAPADFPIGGRPLREVLIDGVSLGPAPDLLFQLYSYITGGTRRQAAKALSSGENPDGDADTLDVLAAIEKFRGTRPDPEAFIEALDPLQPRLYSIASSPKIDPHRLALTVDAVRYPIGARTRVGVASTFCADRIAAGTKVRAYVQRAQHFALPADSSVPVVMIGPGTGIAPFRAFLYERMATKAPGRNWLFFGHQRSGYDFFYEDELSGMKAARVLTRLTLAWSRDAKEKIYVQDRMRDVGRDLWAWLADGAHIYVCGDAKRMAKDVEAALIEVVATFGLRSTNEAIGFVAEMKKSGRYQQDVY
jgi:sulfite reductase (NADPH) flavoprotein alpha-component